MVMQHYLDEDLVITRDDIAAAYVRLGHKAAELLSGKARVITLFSFLSCSVAEQQCYTDLVECCRNLAQAAGVNYTTIMNLEVFS